MGRQDSDGYISAKEMQNALLQLDSGMKETELEAEMREYDRNADHRIDFEEFKSILGSKETAKPTELPHIPDAPAAICS